MQRSNRRVPYPLVLSLILYGLLLAGASCALFEPEDSLAPTPTITAPVPTTAAEPIVTSTSSPATSTTQAPATTAVPDTTTTTSPVGMALDYLEQLLATRADITRLAVNVEQINNDWDDRSQTEVSFSDTELALEAAVESAQSLQDAFIVIEAPSVLGLWDEHRIATSAVEILAGAPQEMLDGLRSPDTGQARRAALVGLRTASDLFGQVTARVAAMIGEEGVQMLDAATADDPAAVAPPAETTTTSTTPAATSTTLGAAPANPGNTKNCSDFSTQAEAQDWFDTYFPFYGDVALLDTNYNNLACEFLP